jgi:hypothetical protein
VETLASGEGDSLGGGEGHLGGGVKFHLGAKRLGEADKAEILNDQGIHPGGGGQAEESFRLGQFGGEDKNIHGEVASPSTGMQVIHNRR